MVREDGDRLRGHRRELPEDHRRAGLSGGQYVVSFVASYRLHGGAKDAIIRPSKSSGLRHQAFQVRA
jgi:hypothetical protein